MNLSRSQQLYLIDVLGVSQVFLPEGQELAVVAPPSVSLACEPADQTSEPTFAVVTEKKLTAVEEQLLQKILLAIGDPQVRCITGDQLSGTSSTFECGIVFGPQSLGDMKSRVELGEVVELCGGQFVVTNDLSTMLGSDPQRVTLVKRQTWGHLKIVKEMMGA